MHLADGSQEEFATVYPVLGCRVRSELALALGARAVLVGRAYLYGLAAAGEPGVRHAIDLLTEQLRAAMALSGVARIEDVGRDLVRRTRG